MITVYVLVYVLHVTPTLQIEQREVDKFWTRDECITSLWIKEAERKAKKPVQDGHHYCKSVWRFKDAK